MRVTIAQTDIVLGNKDENLRSAKKIIEKVPGGIVLFPELFTTGFDFDNRCELSETIPGETTDAICEACGESIVGGSIIERDEGGIYNTFFLASSGGVLGTYRKIHLFEGEKKHFTPGQGAVVVETDFGALGLATCYDIRFPELFRDLVRKGAEVVLVAAEFPRPRSGHWKTLLGARAIENQVFVIAANRVGADNRQEYFGNSMIVDPWGDVLLEGGEGGEVLSCDIDLSRVSEVRKAFPVLSDSKIL